MRDRRDNKGRVLRPGEYQAGDGRYSYRYTDNTGKIRYAYSWTLTATDRTPKGKKVGKCLRDIEAEIAKDLHDGINSSIKTTLDECVQRYMQLHTTLRDSTRNHYMCMYNAHVKPRIGSMPVAAITYSDIKRLYNDLVYDAGLNPASLGVIHNVINPALRMAVRDNLIRSNPAAGVKGELSGGDESGGSEQALTRAQEAALLQFVQNSTKYRWLAPITILLDNEGTRIGEACALTWDDCDFEREIIRIERTLQYYPDADGKHRYHCHRPKTGAGTREIPMMPAVKAMLQQERKRQLMEGFCTVEVDGVAGFIFANKSGGVMSPRNYARALELAIREYNMAENTAAEAEKREPLLIPRICPHALRHTFCTRLCEDGINIKVIQEIMGHSDPSVTMDIYNNVTTDFREAQFEEIKRRAIY